MTELTSTLLHITDLHLLGEPGSTLLGVDTADSYRAVLAQAFAEATPDAVLATGDIAHNAEVEAYQRFADVLDEFHRGPRLVVPGNHDCAEPMRWLLEAATELPLPGWSVITFDSHVDNEPGAALAAVELQRLQDLCAAASAAGTHVLLATHHPPVLVGCPWLDKDRIQNAAELLDYLSEHTSVAAMVFGHAHQIVETRHDGIALLGTPSTCFQFAPRSERFAIDTTKPGYRWLQLKKSGELTSRVGRVLDYPLHIDLSRKH